MASGAYAKHSASLGFSCSYFLWGHLEGYCQPNLNGAFLGKFTLAHIWDHRPLWILDQGSLTVAA